jgi:hypothetical protein
MSRFGGTEHYIAENFNGEKLRHKGAGKLVTA